jgi:hypothetical protein
MLRLILGIIKGVVVGGLIGYGLIRANLTGTFFAVVACALVGALVGLIAGRAPWKAETFWTPVVKMIVGAVIGGGLAALGVHFLPAKAFSLPHVGALTLSSAPVLAVVVGILYGIFVEVDDGGNKGVETAAGKKKSA